MATELHPSQTVGFYEDLIKSIGHPEPMCLILVRFDVEQVKANESITRYVMSEVPDAIRKAIESRIQEDLREYDLVSQVESNAYAVVLKTLADEIELAGRLESIRQLIAHRYTFDGIEVKVNLDVGHAIRKPGEGPAALLSRADSNTASFQSGTVV